MGSSYERRGHVNDLDIIYKERNLFTINAPIRRFLSRFAARCSARALYEPGRLAQNYIRFFINFYCGALQLEKF